MELNTPVSYFSQQSNFCYFFLLFFVANFTFLARFPSFILSWQRSKKKREKKKKFPNKKEEKVS